MIIKHSTGKSYSVYMLSIARLLLFVSKQNLDYAQLQMLDHRFFTGSHNMVHGKLSPQETRCHLISYICVSYILSNLIILYHITGSHNMVHGKLSPQQQEWWKEGDQENRCHLISYHSISRQIIHYQI